MIRMSKKKTADEIIEEIRQISQRKIPERPQLSKKDRLELLIDMKRRGYPVQHLIDKVNLQPNEYEVKKW